MSLVQDTFVHQGGPRFSWNMGKQDEHANLLDSIGSAHQKT